MYIETSTMNDYTRKAVILKFAPVMKRRKKGSRKIYERVIILP